MRVCHHLRKRGKKIHLIATYRFSVITCMMFDWVRSKPFLGLMGTVSAAMACVAAFGLAIYLGFEFIGINLAAPFLMIGKCSGCPHAASHAQIGQPRESLLLFCVLSTNWFMF